MNIEDYLDNLPDNVNAISIPTCFRASSLPPLTRFTNLQSLHCSNSEFTTLPELPNSLIELNCYDNNKLTSLPELPNSLTQLYCNDNQLTSLPALANLHSLTKLYCNDNQLTSLPALPDFLTVLHCGNNQLTTLPTLPNSLTTLVCNKNQLTSLPTLPNSLTTLVCDDNVQRFLTPAQQELFFGINYDSILNVDINLLERTLLEPSNAVIHPNTDMGTDYISGEEMTSQNYVREDSNNVVFYFNGQVLCFSNRTDIRDHILTNTSNIKFGCREIQQRFIVPERSNVILDVPYVAMRSLGCMVGLVPLAQINELVANENIHYVEIVPTNTRLVTTASLQMLVARPNAVGASHCQGGQEELVYQLKTIQEPTTESAVVGGKHKRRNKTKHRKFGSKFGSKCKTSKVRKNGRNKSRKCKFESRKIKK